MSTKASIAHPVTRVALGDTVAVHSRREALARAGRREPPVNFRDHHQRSLHRHPSPRRGRRRRRRVRCEGQSAKLLWILGTLLLIAL
jgi:hypothetical protein